MPPFLPQIQKLLFEALNIAIGYYFLSKQKPEFEQALLAGFTKRSLLVPVIVGIAAVGTVVTVVVVGSLSAPTEEYTVKNNTVYYGHEVSRRDAVALYNAFKELGVFSDDNTVRRLLLGKDSNGLVLKYPMNEQYVKSGKATKFTQDLQNYLNENAGLTLLIRIVPVNGDYKEYQ